MFVESIQWRQCQNHHGWRRSACPATDRDPSTTSIAVWGRPAYNQDMICIRIEAANCYRAF